MLGMGNKTVMDATGLIDRSCEVWSETDAAARADKLKAVLTTGATYIDPTIHAPGSEGLLGHVARVREPRPGSKVVRTVAVDLHHGVARFAWRADGEAVRDGIDIAFINADGTRLDRIIGFFGPLSHDAGETP
jgi:hypothetical protein